MIYSHNTSPKLDESLFKNPTAGYRGIPFWSWNCRVTEELIDSQLDCFKKMGFGGVDIHPRTGLDTEYLGDEYMRLVRYTVRRCKEKGLFCWLYDEDRFPSGNAGGLVTKNYRLRGRYLLLTERRGMSGLLPEYCRNKQEFEAAIDAGEKPAGYYAAAYGLTMENGRLKEYRRLKGRQEIADAYGKGERVRFAYVRMMDEEHWFEDQAYVDTMNPEAVAEFIKVTHEAYYREVGSDFETWVPAIFTDEPRLGKHVQISAALSGEDVFMPYTDYLAEQMMLCYGTDPLDIAPEYIWEMADETYSVNRYRYRNMASECFVHSFMDQIGGWCAEHGIAMTGHVLSEDSLSSQSVTVGDCMRCYRSMDLPGIDILCDFKEFVTAKQASSAARQNGKEGVVSELYGVTHWDCDFKTYKLQGDWQAALGITVRVPHLSYMSMKGEAKRDWPASIFYQSPWYEEFSYIEDYFARLNTALTRGKAVVKIGVVHPVESMWLYFGPNDQTADMRGEMDRDFRNLTEWLLYGTLDFDFLSEALLPEQCPAAEDQDERLLRVGEMEYSVIVVPGLTTIRSTTLELLEAFADRGGRVLFMGRIPELVDARQSGRALRLAKRCARIGKSQAELYEALEAERVLEIRKENGCRSDNLFCQMRQDGTGKWLFICHVNRRDDHGSEAERYIVKIKGSYQVSLYDAMTGNITEAPSEREGGFTVLSLVMYHEDSVLWRLDERDTDEGEKGGVALPDRSHSFRPLTSLSRPSGFRRLEPNVLLLDCARFQVDDGVIREKKEILRLDNEIRSQLGFVLRKERMNQPWFMREKETHKVTLYYDIQSQIETQASLALEDVESCSVCLNGEAADMCPTGYYVDPAISVIKLPPIHEGENRLVVEMKYNQKSGLENLYVLGDFDVELNGTEAVLKEERKQLLPGDITGQGMPFYTGNLEYSYRLCTEEEEAEYEVHIPHFKAPLLAVFVDGDKKGLIAYAPHRLRLGNLAPGEHELTILLYGNRFNGFGTLHNADEKFVWYGPDSYRTEKDAWTDCYLVRPVGILSAVEVEEEYNYKGCHRDRVFRSQLLF